MSKKTTAIVTMSATALMLAGTAGAVGSVPSKAHQYGSGLHAVDALSDTDAWAVGAAASGPGVLVEHWNGSTWTVQDTPQPPGSNGFLGLDARTHSDVWAVGDMSRDLQHTSTYAQHWDGSSWQVTQTVDPGRSFSSLTDVSAVSSRDAWAVGSYLTKATLFLALVERWDGSAWHTVESANLGAGCFGVLEGVEAVTSDDVWAVGSQDCRSTPQRALFEHWNGASWSVVGGPVLPHDSHLTGLSAVSSNDVWAVGSTRSGGEAETLVEHWNGSTWSRVTSPDPGGARCHSHELARVSASSAHLAWAVGYQGCGDTVRSLTMQWDGTRWRSQKSPTPPFGDPAASILADVVSISRSSALAVGTAPTAGGIVGFIQRWNAGRWTFQ